MKKIRQVFMKWKTELIAAGLLLLLSLAMIFAGFRFYRQYRAQVIETEESQLLTMAGIIGNNLNMYLEQQLDQIDLFYAQEAEASSPAQAESIEARTSYFLKESGSLYNWIAVTEPDGTRLRYEPGKAAVLEQAEPGRGLQQEEDNQRSPERTAKDIERDGTQYVGGILESADQSAWISGKEISDQTGWYELYIQKEVPSGDGICTLTFALNLETLYQKIVAPVKIGKDGYSSVKDQNMYIIMHHAKEQIGLEALDDRLKKYPDLNLSSMNDWLKKQAQDASGTGVIDTYVWDDPGLARVQRVVAFQSIYIQGERWIVNSTIPIRELSGPLDSMMTMLTGAVFLYILLLVVATVFLLRNRFLAETQQKEITYLKEINQGMEMLAQKNNEIRHYQRIQSLGMMASHIAHEFNNYLTPVLIYAELLENDDSITPENQEMIHEITEAVDKASNLSKELLAFSRQDTGVRLELLNLTEEVESAVSIVRQLAPSAINVKTEVTQEPLYVLGRRRMAEHILMNLCKNAFQAMEKTETKELWICLYAKDSDTICLQVSDTGCGIGDDAMQKIFEPFYTTKGSRQGTGLGLSVVQNMVTSVGGSIRVESKADAGTTFILEIPQSRSEEEKDSRKRLKQVRKIAIVSREESAKTWKNVSARSQKTVDLYAHPAALIDRIQKNPAAYDLVIAEYTLPTMNGIDLCEVIRRINPEIRLILIAEQSGADFEWYLNNGMIDRFMLKEEFAEEFAEMFG